MRFLLDLKRSEPDLDRDATIERLDAWWRSR